MAVLLESLWSQSTFLLVLLLICLYYVSVAFYRLYLSPLANFPGPKLAALTYWVEFYHDVFRRGQYTFEIVKMHDKYGKCGSGSLPCISTPQATSGDSIVTGPIVRITPDELHINDRDYYEEVYPGV